MRLKITTIAIKASWYQEQNTTQLQIFYFYLYFSVAYRIRSKYNIFNKICKFDKIIKMFFFSFLIVLLLQSNVLGNICQYDMILDNLTFGRILQFNISENVELPSNNFGVSFWVNLNQPISSQNASRIFTIKTNDTNSQNIFKLSLKYGDGSYTFIVNDINHKFNILTGTWVWVGFFAQQNSNSFECSMKKIYVFYEDDGILNDPNFEKNTFPMSDFVHYYEEIGNFNCLNYFIPNTTKKLALDIVSNTPFVQNLKFLYIYYNQKISNEDDVLQLVMGPNSILIPDIKQTYLNQIGLKYHFDFTEDLNYKILNRKNNTFYDFQDEPNYSIDSNIAGLVHGNIKLPNSLSYYTSNSYSIIMIFYIIKTTFPPNPINLFDKIILYQRKTTSDNLIIEMELNPMDLSITFTNSTGNQVYKPSTALNGSVKSNHCLQIRILLIRTLNMPSGQVLIKMTNLNDPSKYDLTTLDLTLDTMSKTDFEYISFSLFQTSVTVGWMFGLRSFQFIDGGYILPGNMCFESDAGAAITAGPASIVECKKDYFIDYLAGRCWKLAQSNPKSYCLVETTVGSLSTCLKCLDGYFFNNGVCKSCGSNENYCIEEKLFIKCSNNMVLLENGTCVNCDNYEGQITPFGINSSCMNYSQSTGSLQSNQLLFSDLANYKQIKFYSLHLLLTYPNNYFSTNFPIGIQINNFLSNKEDKIFYSFPNYDNKKNAYVYIYNFLFADALPSYEIYLLNSDLIGINNSVTSIGYTYFMQLTALVDGRIIHNCPSGVKYSKDGTCIEGCPQYCRVCDDFNSCIQCIESYSKYQDKCYDPSSCPESTFLKNDKTECLPCNMGITSLDTNCVNCEGQQDNCTSCKPNYFLKTNYAEKKTECVKECDKFFFNNDIKCISCIPNCILCETNTTCHECDHGYSMLTSLDSGVKCIQNCSKLKPYEIDNKNWIETNHFHTNLSECFSCPFGAPACNSPIEIPLTIENNNTKCANESYLLKFSITKASRHLPFGDLCVEECPKGYYLDKTTKVCFTCEIGCLECIGKNECIRCKNYYAFKDKKCVPELELCDFGVQYFFNEKTNTHICKYCALSNCDICENYKTCQACHDGYRFFNKECLNECPEGYQKSIKNVCDPIYLNLTNAGWKFNSNVRNKTHQFFIQVDSNIDLGFQGQDNTNQLITNLLVQAMNMTIYLKDSGILEYGIFYRFDGIPDKVNKTLLVINVIYEGNVDFFGVRVRIGFAYEKISMFIKKDYSVTYENVDIKKVNIQELDEEEKKKAELHTNVLKTVGTAIVIANFPLVISGFISIFWNVIDTLQIIDLHKYLNLTYPANVQEYFNFLGNVNLDFMEKILLPCDTDQNTLEIFHNKSDSFFGILNCTRILELQPGNQNFLNDGKSGNLILNLMETGTLLLFFVTINVMVAVIVFILPQKLVLMRAVGLYVKESMQFSLYIRTLLETDLILVLYVGIQISNSNFTTYFTGSSSVLSYMLVPLIILYPYIMFKFINWVIKHIKANDKKVEAQYGSYILEYQSIGMIQSSTAVYQTFRRISISFIIGALNPFPFASGLILVLISMCSAIYFAVLRPFKSQINNLQNILLAFMMIIFELLLLMLIMIDEFEFLVSNKDRMFFGRLYLIWMNVMLLVQMIFAVASVIVHFRDIKLNMKRFFHNNYARFKMLLNGTLGDHILKLKDHEETENDLEEKSSKDIELTTGTGESMMTRDQIELFLNSRLMQTQYRNTQIQIHQTFFDDKIFLQKFAVTKCFFTRKCFKKTHKNFFYGAGQLHFYEKKYASNNQFEIKQVF